MVHVRYHKSQRQTGDAVDNIRFLPPAIGNLLLTFLAIVQPLRELFLRQLKPGILLSPYLFSHLEGQVWPDKAVSRCLRKAYLRAEVPVFQVAWWRQAAASITKEKFSPRERANFHMDDMGQPEEDLAEEEGLLVDLAESSNHSFRTFNAAYAGSTTLTMNTLLHRAHRASSSWRALFQVDALLADLVIGGGGGGGQKRKHAAQAGRDFQDYKQGGGGGSSGESDSGSGQGALPRACKQLRLRSRPLAKAATLQDIARRLYANPTL